MAPRPPTKAEIDAASALINAFPGATFETVYEGLGETWDFNVSPVLVGYFQRRETTQMLKYGSKTDFEERNVYTLKLSDDSLAAVWGSYSLDRGLQNIETGVLVRLTYNGKNPIGESDREVKDFKVEVSK